jgi:hypothetical protein
MRQLDLGLLSQLLVCFFGHLLVRSEKFLFKHKQNSLNGNNIFYSGDYFPLWINWVIKEKQQKVAPAGLPWILCFSATAIAYS